MNKKLSCLLGINDPVSYNIIQESTSEFSGTINFEIAKDAFIAYNLIKSNIPDIFLFDHKLPKSNEIGLLNKLKSDNELKYIFSIVILSGQDEMLIREIFQSGADSIITKPFNSDDVYIKLYEVLKFIELRRQFRESNKLLNELADELNKVIEDTKHLAVKFQQSRIPVSYDIANRIVKASVWLARELKELDADAIADIETAASLCFIGKISLPDELINNPVQNLGQATHKLMYQVPSNVKEILSELSRYKSVSDTLEHLYENLDGSGFPDRLRLWQIPLGSRIIRVALDYEMLRHSSAKNAREALNIIKNDIRRLYDHRIVALFEQYIKSVVKEDYDPNEMPINLKDMKNGMLLTQDIITNVGLKLVSAGVKLNPHTIETIMNHNTSDPIIGKIYVRK